VNPVPLSLADNHRCQIKRWGKLVRVTNFDAKVRRESFEPVDLFHAAHRRHGRVCARVEKSPLQFAKMDGSPSS